jgi:hypothetical protein
MNFCVTDGVSVVATRYVSSRNDAAASLVCTPFNHLPGTINLTSSRAFSGFLQGRLLANTRRVDIIKCPRQTSAKT